MVDFNKINDYFRHTKIPENMLERGQLVLNNFLNPIKILFEQKSVPEEPWSDEQIDLLLQVLSNMDTDKDDKAARVGEREARIASKLHLKTSSGFCHGVGRSGFLTAPQPKAPGASMMYVLSNYLATSFLKKFGLPNIKKAIVVPICTGMSLALCLSALRPDWSLKELSKKRTIIVPRIDHKSLLKAFDLVGCEKKIIEGKIFGDAVRVPFSDIEKSFDKNCFGIVSVTSFFPPREHDELKEISKFAKEHQLVHIIVNAYGVQSPEWMKMIRSAIDAGRVDAIVQSTDKNFLTPIGGAVIASPNKNIIEKISQTYPGRASASPVVDFLISILSLGIEGYEKLLKKQQENRLLLRNKMEEFSKEIGERILDVFNPVAVAMSLKNLETEKLTALGGALYNLRVTGPRVYNSYENPFGISCENYPTPYIVMNAAIGASSEDVVNAIEKLKKAFFQIS
ncbi:MAG: O-phosphoseryl-tRNA(Sec) selenium transferase [Candidatus Lokiarchaeota archaeon]|nr:O-phosphoseryl-tRNA(Sec) selenium transferase [Candidatus Lokiarchaeota archaeon]MBD3340332.1 O-phosphoseryl-tRNA(Sec) selenium transferase [Candidatus Lokiarchaeota archaeon]